MLGQPRNPVVQGQEQPLLHVGVEAAVEGVGVGDGHPLVFGANGPAA